MVDVTDGEELGAYLRDARQRSGLTQEELAERTGLSVRAISDLERGRTASPRKGSLRLLTEVLGLPDSASTALADPSGEESDTDVPTGPARTPAAPDTPARDEWPARMAAARPADEMVPAQLPMDVADFTGRGPQVSDICAALMEPLGRHQPGAVPVVLIAGPGGIGKSTVAVHAAHRVAAEFPDGQLYANRPGC